MALHLRRVNVGHIGDLSKEGENCSEKSMLYHLRLKARERDLLSTIDTMPVRLDLRPGDKVGEAVPDSCVTNTRWALASVLRVSRC